MTTLICQPINQTKPCAKHGVVERGKDGKCKKCKTIWQRESRKKNIDYVKQKNKEYKEKNKFLHLEQNRMLDKKNPYSARRVKMLIASSKAFLSLSLSKKDIPPELVEIKRLQMELHRAIKQREKLEKVL